MQTVPSRSRQTIREPFSARATRRSPEQRSSTPADSTSPSISTDGKIPSSAFDFVWPACGGSLPGKPIFGTSSRPRRTRWPSRVARPSRRREWRVDFSPSIRRAEPGWRRARIRSTCFARGICFPSGCSRSTPDFRRARALPAWMSAIVRAAFLDAIYARELVRALDDELGGRCSTVPAAASAIRSSRRSWRGRCTGAFATVDALTLEAHRAVLERVPDVDDVLVDDGGDERELAERLARNDYEACVVTWATPRTARIAQMAAIPVRVGQARRIYSFRFTDRVVVRSENGDVTSHWSDDSARLRPRDRLRHGRPAVSLRAHQRTTSERPRSSAQPQGVSSSSIHATPSLRGDRIWPLEGWAALALRAARTVWRAHPRERRGG